MTENLSPISLDCDYLYGLLVATRYFTDQASGGGASGNHPTTPDVIITYDSLGRRKVVTQAIQTIVNNESVTRYPAIIEYAYASDLGVDTETTTYDVNLDGTAELTRVVDRANRSFGRNTGFTLGTVANHASDQAVSYGYSTDTGQFKTVSNGTDTFNYGYTYTQATGGSRVGATTGDGLKQDFIPYALTKSGTPTLQTIRTYEPTRDVLASIQNKVDTTVVSKYDYSTVNREVNSLGQRMGVQTTFNLTGTPTVQATSWDYDSFGQITSADAPGSDADRAYQYDTIGNRLFAEKGAAQIPANPGLNTTAYTPDTLNQYDAITPYILDSSDVVIAGTPVEPVFDDDGNMETGPLPVSPGSNCTLVWDAENRLTEVKNSSNVTLVKTIYDAFSRRIATVTDPGGTPATTLYVYDGWNCIAEYTIQNSIFTIQNSNLWGLDLSGSLQGAGGVGGLLAVNDGTTSYYPTYDGNGNVSEYLEANGDVAAHYEYDPFGNDISPAPPTGTTYVNFAYRFSTKPLDSLTGLYYYVYRWYDPLTGRWPSRDPIEEEGGMNPYGFVGNDGIDDVDLLGLALHAFDGTWNDKEQMKGHPTNVAILWDSYTKLKFYYKGVGTIWWTEHVGGLTGAGGQNRINDAMNNLQKQLELGDCIVDIVGFSRGAAEAREFANRIAREHIGVKVRFMGLFDTVASEGIPGNDVNIGYDLKIKDHVRYVFQATANGEQRRFFPLHSIKSKPGDRNTKHREERGFPGAHSDVGGGYEDGDLSDGPLVWMWQKGRAVGVPFGQLPADRLKITKPTVHHEGGQQDPQRRIFNP